jgi:hypothetical protein
VEVEQVGVVIGCFVLLEQRLDELLNTHFKVCAIAS